MEQEIWKDVIGFEGIYQVSSIGRVKSVKRVYSTWNYSKVRDEFIMSFYGKLSNRDGKSYRSVDLSKQGRKYKFRVQRLVAIAFIANPENKPFVNHIDANPENNHISNLEWYAKRKYVPLQKNGAYRRQAERLV